MRRCQTSRQHWVSQLQPYLLGFLPRKYQKPHLEILGSLIFCVGLTFGKPAWSAPEVGSAALSVANTEQQGTVEAKAASTEGHVIQSHPEVLPPGTIGEAAKEWSQLVDTNGTSLREDSNASLGTDTQERPEREDSSQNLSNLSLPSQSSIPITPNPIQAQGERDRGTEGEGERGREGGAERENASTQSQDEEQPFTPGLSPQEQAPELPLSSSCPSTQQQILSSEQKPQCNPKPPSLVADVENALPPLPQPSPSENSSESQQPASEEDPELGKLRLRELAPPPPPPKPAVYLFGGAGYFRSNNIFSGIDPVDDGLFKAGVTLLAAPSIGPQTSLFASVGGNIYRYSDLSVYDYDELNFSAGIRQQLGSRTYGELGWSNRQLFSEDSGDRFLDDHSVYLELGRRDFLTRKLTLDTFYQLRLSFANPSDRSQVINYLGASLGYTPIPPIELALGYQFAFSDFTQQERQDQYHQLIGSVTYNLNPNSRLYLYGGHSFGNSSDEYTDFDGLVFGAGVNFNVTLF